MRRFFPQRGQRLLEVPSDRLQVRMLITKTTLSGPPPGRGFTYGGNRGVAAVGCSDAWSDTASRQLLD